MDESRLAGNVQHLARTFIFCCFGDHILHTSLHPCNVRVIEIMAGKGVDYVFVIGLSDLNSLCAVLDHSRQQLRPQCI